MAIKIKAVCMLSALSVAFLAAVPAKAAANCDFKSNLKELADAQENYAYSGSQENLKNELSVRKKIISQTLDCSINEALSLQSGIKLLETNSSDLREIKGRIVSKIDEIIGYYQTQKNSVNDLGIGGSKIFSANFKSWRESNYVPIAELGKNLPVFVKNQEVLQITQNRLDQITITMKTLGLAEIPRIADLIGQARKNIQLANDDNNFAKDSFKKLSWPNDISDRMISSLQRLKDAYQNFFDIGKAAQEIISAK